VQNYIPQQFGLPTTSLSVAVFPAIWPISFPRFKEIIMKKTLLALALFGTVFAASAVQLGVGVGAAGSGATSTSNASSGGVQGSALIGVSAGHQDAAAVGGAKNVSTVGSNGTSSTSTTTGATSTNQVGASLGLAGQAGASGATSQNTATGGAGLIKGFVFLAPF
jgi:hypothetical protein